MPRPSTWAKTSGRGGEIGESCFSAEGGSTVKRLSFIGRQSRLVVVACLALVGSAASSKDLSDLCFDPKPGDQERAKQWDKYCPSLYEQQYEAKLASDKADAEKAKIENAEKLAKIVTATAAVPSPDKVDSAAFGAVARQYDAALTFAAARAIAQDLPLTTHCSSPGSLRTPIPEVGAREVRFSWHAWPNADSYAVAVWNMESPPMAYFDRPKGPELTMQLEPNRTYGWTVAGCNSSGCGASTPFTYFRTTGPAEATNDTRQSNTESPASCELEPVLLVTGAERNEIVAGNTAEVLVTEMNHRGDRAAKLGCSKDEGAPGARAVDIASAAAWLSLTSSAATLFQPQLLSAKEVDGLSERQQLIAAGLSSAFQGSGWSLRLHAPAIKADNKVIEALEKLRMASLQAAGRLAICPDDDKIAQAGKAELKEIDQYVSGLLKSDGTARSAVALAARQSALAHAGIKHTLLVSPDVGGGAAALVKPSAFSSLRVLEAAALVMSYQLVNLDTGKPVAAGCKAARWKSQTKVTKWPSPTFESEPTVTDCISMAR